MAEPPGGTRVPVSGALDEGGGSDFTSPDVREASQWRDRAGISPELPSCLRHVVRDRTARVV
ncbi:hypothetical protein SSAG_03051 [Streptomyces sp. Mg1]|nr:hypothetical protein SSAG_03051 [Streptomyces sp. Mg1]